MLGADVPLFRAVDPDAGTRYGMGLVGEFGIRLFEDGGRAKGRSPSVDGLKL